MGVPAFPLQTPLPAGRVIQTLATVALQALASTTTVILPPCPSQLASIAAPTPLPRLDRLKLSPTLRVTATASLVTGESLQDQTSTTMGEMQVQFLHHPLMTVAGHLCTPTSQPRLPPPSRYQACLRKGSTVILRFPLVCLLGFRKPSAPAKIPEAV